MQQTDPSLEVRVHCRRGLCLDGRPRGGRHPLSRIREVSLEIATAVAEIAWKRGLTDRPRPADPRSYVASTMYQPIYPIYAADAE